jgi:hypothetical protein
MIFNLAYPDVSRHLLLLGTSITMVSFSYFVSQKVERRYARGLKNILESAFTSVSKYLDECCEVCL